MTCIFYEKLRTTYFSILLIIKTNKKICAEKIESITYKSYKSLLRIDTYITKSRLLNNRTNISEFFEVPVSRWKTFNEKCFWMKGFKCYMRRAQPITIQRIWHVREFGTGDGATIKKMTSLSCCITGYIFDQSVTFAIT